MVQMGFCDFLGFIFVSYCLRQRNADKKISEKFQLDFQWSYLNFTWPSVMEYHDAVTTFRYIPENNAMAGIKYYNNRMFIALPRLRPGTPVTLAFVPINSKSKLNPLLRPYPSWEMNVQRNCSSFQNVQSMEIDKYGIMWVLDGVRINNFTRCPPKIVLLDLNNGGKVLQTHIVPAEVSLHRGGFLNDLVVDETDGGYAYITDNSNQDPGIVVYSRHSNKSWKLRDATMFAELDAADFSVDGVPNEDLVPVDGIALEPMPKSRDDNRLVYYCALSGLNLYAISTEILKDEEFIKSGLWRKEVFFVGRKQSQSDGLAMDNKGNLYYGMLSKYGIGRWNIKKDFNTARKIATNRNKFIWPDSFTFDLSGNLYVLSNGINKFFSRTYELKLSTEIKFRILRFQTGTVSLPVKPETKMNSFLQGCCYIPPEDDLSIPSFSNYEMRTVVCSRSSTASFRKCNLSPASSKEIFFIKPCTAAWGDFDEEGTQSSSDVTEIPSGNACKNIARSRSSYKGSSSNSLLISSGDINERMSFWICDSRTAKDYKHSHKSAYGFRSPKQPVTSTNKLLDLISTCFWKCSSGCQQIPTIST